jgi:hypothetical protein
VEEPHFGMDGWNCEFFNELEVSKAQMAYWERVTHAVEEDR